MHGVKALLVATGVLIAVAGHAEDRSRTEGSAQMLLGRDARDIIELLGAPRQDVREGVGRKLQFGNDACILDVYLYPQSTNDTPIAVYLSARVPDGREAEKTSCFNVLRGAR